MTVPFDLTGNYSVETVDPQLRRIALSGSGMATTNLQSLYGEATTKVLIGTVPFTQTIPGTLFPSISLAFSYQLEDIVVVPEPGSVALLIVGSFISIGLVGRRLRSGRYRRQRD